MMHVKRLALAFVLAFIGTVAAQAADLVLADQGKSDYQIVLPDKSASPSLEKGLNQVARLVQTAFKANGAELPVVMEANADKAKPGVYLGDTAFARANGIEASKLKDWNYVIKVVGRDIIIAGHEQIAAGGEKGNPSAPTRDRIGTAKAAADFLRLYAGTRFLYPDVPNWGTIDQTASVDWLKSPSVEFLPTATIQVPSDLNIAQTVVLKYNIAWASPAGFFDVANNRFPIVDEVFGGHTHQRAIPPEKYGKDHPEYFALVGGKRLVDSYQYCISNPEVQELMYQDLLFWLDAGYDTVDLGQSDGFRPCECENCKNLFNTGNDWSEKLWILHRNLAERVLEARPGKQISIMAYIQTAMPPKSFRPLPANVRLMLTGTNEDDIAPWKEFGVPGGFTGYLYNWCANLGTRYTPMRTPRFVESQVKRLVSNNFQAITRDGPGSLYGLEGPVYYTMGRMFDDAANLQAKVLVNEFNVAAFGKAAPAMSRFYDQLYHGIELYSEFLGTRCPGWAYVNIYGGRPKYLSDPFQFIGFLYTPRFMAALDKELSQAETLADTDKVKARLALVRREFDFVRDMARVVQLYQAYELQPDQAMRDRLLDAIDERNAHIAALYDERGNAKPMDGWQVTLFPIPGHNSKHLQLDNDGYQEPYKNTCFNWDTKAMRNAPLPGAARLAIRPAAGAVALESDAWQGVDTVTLGGLPSSVTPNSKTTFQTLSDKEAFYLRFECELPADLMKTPASKEALTLFLTPSSAKDISYSFTVGMRAAAKYDAASGFIEDVMDPRFGQYDPDWKGDWTYETKLLPEKNLWLGMLKIPYTTLGVEAPAAKSSWRMNVGRVHVVGANQVERSIWSSASSTKDMEDRSVFGEAVFEAAGTAAKSTKHPMQIWREEYNGTTGEVPVAWKALPNQLPALGPWAFRADPADQGINERWFAADAKTADWLPVKVPAFWVETEAIGDYHGIGWYRTTFTPPAEWKGKTLRLLFAAVDEEAWIYVNGKPVGEHSVKSEGKPIDALWEASFTVDVAPESVNFGQPNVLVVRVNNSTANGGIWRPVMACAVDKK